MHQLLKMNLCQERIWIYVLKGRWLPPFPLLSLFSFLESAELTAWKEASPDELINNMKMIIVTHHTPFPQK